MGIIFGIVALVLFVIGFNPIAQAFYKNDFSNKNELLFGANNVLLSALLISMFPAYFAAALISIWAVVAIAVTVGVSFVIYVLRK